MNEEPAVLFERRSSVAWVTINRPEKRNAVNDEARALLADALAEAGADPSVHAVVLAGAGAAFCAGVDLGSSPPPTDHVLARDPAPLVAPVVACPKPVVAAVGGAAVGGGFELALAADCRIASRSAFFALPEGRIGSMPGSGGTQRLFRAVPSAIAWHMLYTGDRLSGERAYEVGLVSELVDDEDLLAAADRLAVRIAESAPLSLRAIKRAGRAAVEPSPEALDLERALWAFLSTTDDRAEGRQAFREKRPPEFEGR